MKALSKLFSIVLILLTYEGFSQCTLNLFSVPDTVICGECATLSAFGTMDGNVAFQEDFNSGAPVGWQFTQTVAIGNNTCGVPSPDGSDFMWMGNTSVNPRDMTTVGFDLTLGGTICFEMRYSIQGDPAPCEGPDEPDEGVFLQYSIDNGVTWITINYWDPNGGNDPNLTNWNQYCATIPAGAMTLNTMIRWHQDDVSGADFDHWGIDNVIITLNDPTSVITWLHDGFSYPMGSGGGNNPTQVCLTSSGTFTAQITNGVNTCTQSITVEVKNPTMVVSATPDTSLCPGQCAQLIGEAKVLVSPASTPTFSNAEINLIAGNPALPCLSFGGCTCADGSNVSLGQNCAGNFDASMNINVQGLNTTTISSGSITGVCISDYNVNLLGLCGALSLADVEIVLICPSGTEIILANRGSLSGNSISNMCFDLGAGSYGAATSPYTGTFAPFNSWLALNGCNANGVWSLELRGANSEFCLPTGSVGGWSISFDDPEISYPANFTWNPTTNMTNSTTLTPTVCPVANTVYTITATDSNNCVVATDNVSITVAPCTCIINSLSVVPTACIPATNFYDVSGSIAFVDPPTTGTLTVTDCHGNNQVFNAPFVSPINYNITGINSDGVACDVTAVFSADPTCTFTTNYTAPVACPTVCSFTFLQVNVGACIPATNTYNLDGFVSFTGAPASGTLTITDNCTGLDTVINAPFTSPQNWSISGLPAGGAGTCDVTAVFSADPACTINLGPAFEYSIPASCIPPCAFTFLQVNISACVPATNTYNLDGFVTFTAPPASGTLTITDNCTGLDTVINAPFTSPQNWSISGLPAGGAGTCDVTAVFSADPTCTINLGPAFEYTIPANCGCPANAGTVNVNTVGNGLIDYILCDNDIININSNGDFTDPLNVGPIGGIPYDPGITYAIYNCPPTPGLRPDLDPCYTGFVTGTFLNMSDQNLNGAAFGLLGALTTPPPAGPGIIFTNNTVYYAPITLYDTASLSFNLGCVAVGPATAVTYLPSILSSNPIENCLDSSFTITINGGYPQLLGGIFTASNLLPATASFVNTTTPNGGTFQINGLQNGDMYSFDVVDTNGCPIAIAGGPFSGLPIANANVDDTVCSFTYNLNAIPSIGTGAWTGPPGLIFSNNTSPTSSITATSAGTFALTWTEDNGGVCTSNDVVNITFSNLVLNATSAQATCGNNDGSITITITGGVTPYQYSIDGGTTFQAGNVFNTLTSGPYNLVVTDAALCQITGIENVGSSGAPTINSVTTIEPSCNGVCDGTVTVVAAGGSGAIQYSIDGGTTFQATGTFTNLCAGTLFSFLAQDALGCSVTTDTILFDPLLLVIDSVPPIDALCFGANDGALTIFTSGGTGTITYSINNGTTFLPTATFNNLAPTIPPAVYDIIVRDANGCTANTTATIAEPTTIIIPPPLITNVSCFGACDGQIVITPSGGTPFTTGSPYTYAWSSGGNSFTESNLCVGNYTVRVTDANGCFIDSTFTVIEPANLTAITASQNANCSSPDGYAAVFNVTGGTGPYTYDWGAGPTTNDTLFNLIPGNYSVTVTDAAVPVGCAITFNITVGNNPSFTASITSSTIPSCNGGANGTATADGSDPTATYLFQWDATASNQTSQTAGGLAANTYTVTVTDQATGCTDQATITIGEPTPVVVTATSPITICSSQSASLTATGSGGSGSGYTYNWDNGTFIGATYTVSPLVNTTYTVFAIDANGCTSASVNVDVIVRFPLSVVASPSDTNICLGQSATINATAFFGLGSNYQFAWSNGFNGPSQVVSPTVTTVYTVFLNDGCSPQVSATVTINIDPLPVIDFLVDDIDGCESPQQLFTFHNIPGATDSTLTWTFGDGTSISGLATNFNPNVDTVTHTYSSGSGTFDVTLTVTTTAAAGNCTNTLPKPAYITIHQNPIADFTMNPNPATMFDPTIDFFDQSTSFAAPPILSYAWDIGGLDSSFLQNPTYTFPSDTGNYLIYLTVTDFNGCMDTSSNTVTVLGEFGIYVPNAFTPDGDALNDGFFPNGFGISDQDYTFFIFDRWGEVIYESHSKFEPWTGTYKGKIVQNGVYVWKLLFTDINGDPHTEIGHVTIVK